MNIKLTNWREDKRNTRKGYCDLTLVDVGLTIKRIAVHECNGKRWVAQPSGETVTTDGEIKHWSYLVFDKGANERLQRAAIEQLKTLAPEL